MNLVLFIFELAVLANIAYCTAYPMGILVQITGYREHWRTLRWGLLVVESHSPEYLRDFGR